MTNDETGDAGQIPSDGTDSTLDDWFGQDVQRDADAADDAMERADGDENEAAKIFEQIRPDHKADEFNVPAEDRPQ